MVVVVRNGGLEGEKRGWLQLERRGWRLEEKRGREEGKVS
jgi:hypothetical protein